MELLFYQKEENGKTKENTLINEPLSKIGASYQGRCRLHILFVQFVKILPNFGLITINQRNVREISYDRLMQSYQRFKFDDDSLNELMDEGASVLDIDLVFFEKPFRLNLRLRKMNVDRIYSEWTPWFQSEIPIYTRFLVEMPKDNCRIFNAEDFNLYLYFGNFSSVSRCPPIICGICLDENNGDKFISYNCGHGMCTACDKRHSSERCCVCDTNKEWKVQVRRRETACPIDTCWSQSDEYVFYPCGCVLAHNFKDQNPRSLIGKCCPYKFCGIQITHITKMYINSVSTVAEY